MGMGKHKTRPKILPFVKIRNENDLPCICVVSFIICSLLEPFGSRNLVSFYSILDVELYCQ